MASFDSDMSIFDKISNEKISQLFDILDESILVNNTTHSRISEIIKDEINNAEVKKLLLLVRYFVVIVIYPNEIINKINKTQLDDSKKILLKQEVQKLYDRVDLDKIKFNLQSKTLKGFGHSHVHDLMFVTEFRPISKSNKIIKLVPSIVVAGTIHNNDLEFDESVNFQLDLKRADELMNNLKIAIQSLNDEIQNMRDKFGDDIID